MSFHWNPSSSEDELETDLRERTKSPPMRTEKVPNESVETTFSHGNGIDEVGFGLESDKQLRVEPICSSSSEDFDEVDWEDVEDEPQRAVTVDLNVKPSANETKKRKRKTRRSYPFRSLPNDLKSLLINIRRAHMLALASRALLMSRCCSDFELEHVVHSMIPRHWTLRVTSETSDMETPSEQQAREFCKWFIDLINEGPNRRQQTLAANIRAGAPRRANHKRRARTQRSKTSPQRTTGRVGQGTTNPQRLLNLCSYFSMANDDNPQLLENNSFAPLANQNEKTQMLVAMIRSLGWRARLVVALDPIKCDLEADHPLFMCGFKDVFRAVLESQGAGVAKKSGSVRASLNQALSIQENYSKEETEETPASKSKGKRVLRSESLEAREVESSVSGVGNGELTWIEILCRPRTPGKRKSQFQWMHVGFDTSGREVLFNNPQVVESLLKTLHNHGGTRKSRSIISHALAVEHRSLDDRMPAVSDGNFIRLTDVTPRYASAWSRTLKQRSVPGTSNDTWWADSLLQTNREYRRIWKAVTKQDGSSSMRSPLARLATKEGLADEAKKHASIDNKQSCATSLPARSSYDDLEEHEDAERKELIESASNEPIPTSKTAFKNHPTYAIPSLLNARQVLAPDAKRRVCGVFKGELVYRRNDVSTAFTEEKWLFNGRKVKSKELNHPVKRVAAQKVSSKGFKALRSYGVGTANDGTEQARQRDIEAASVPLDEGNDMEALYGIWQTRPWSPPRVGPNDAIPVNEYNNIDLRLLSPGLTHLDLPKMSLVAKKLQVPYAPALLGFEGHGGNRAPAIKGIVVHDHNAALLREAYAECQSQNVENEIEKEQHQIRKKWKKLIVGILTKDRLEREYGEEHNDT